MPGKIDTKNVNWVNKIHAHSVNNDTNNTLAKSTKLRCFNSYWPC